MFSTWTTKKKKKRIFLVLYLLIEFSVAQNLFKYNNSNSNNNQKHSSLKGSRNELNGKFLKQPDNTTLASGKRLLLRCRPNLTVYIRDLHEKNPNLIKYEWYRDNKPIEPSAKNNIYKDGSLEIVQAAESDTGFYKCVARFRSPTFESRQAYVKVVDRVVGNKNTLSSSSPSPSSTTMASSISRGAATSTKPPPKFQLSPEDKNVQVDDEVILECLALNDASTQLLSPSSSSTSGSNATDLQYYRYKWLKDGIAVDLRNRNSRLQFVQGYSLKIERTSESDTGTYTCRICNSNGGGGGGGGWTRKSSYYEDRYESDNLDSNAERDECDERSAFLKVLVPPRFVRQPVPLLNVTLKSDAELECSAYGVPTPTIQWFKNGEPIYPSEYFQLSAHTGTLKILGIIAQDEGYYQCLASNELNTIQAVAQLVVVDATHKSTTAADDVDESSNDDDNETRDYQQEQVGLSSLSPLDYYESNDVAKKKKTSLASTKAMMYATSTHPVVHLSAPMKLKVVKAKSRSLLIEWQPPSIIRDEHKQEEEKEDSYDDIEGGGSSELVYLVQWTAKSTGETKADAHSSLMMSPPRQREAQTSNRTLVIDELQPETTYVVLVCAQLGHTRSPYASIDVKTLHERPLPGRPLDFRAEFVDDVIAPSPSSSSSSASPGGESDSNRLLRLKWKKPAQNWETIIKYRLYYQHLYYGPTVQQFNTPDGNMSSNSPAGDVDSSPNYQSLLQYDDEESSSSENDVAQISENNQSDYGESEAGDASSKSLMSSRHIDINPIKSSTPNDDYQTYDLRLDDFHRYSTYRMRLVALDAASLSLLQQQQGSSKSQSSSSSNVTNGGGSSFDSDSYSDLVNDENSAELVVETPSDVPDAPPEAITAETINTTSILLQWLPPALAKRNGVIIGYKIAIKENDKQVWNSNVDSEPRRKIIAGLLPGHKYSFRITARTINGSGPASDWYIAETFSRHMDESRVPGKPVELHAEPTDRSIIVHWTPPSDSNSTVVRRYLLKYGIGFPITEIEVPGSRNSYIINGLTPSSQYVISLKAVNNAGYGMEILKDVITKRKSALGENENLFPPLNVQAVAVSSQSIEVRWTDWHLKPEETIPDDRYYSVRYCITTQQQQQQQQSESVEIATAASSTYSYKNSTERRVIISDLTPNTLYDFSVKVVIGTRESDWSLTTSQMTMEAAPAPRSIKIRSDPHSPTTVIISWMAPKLPSNSGYVISYIDEATYKVHANKWKIEHVSAKQEFIEHRIRRLRPETVYYFKIQSRTNRAYGTSSPTIIFKTPNMNGEGGGKIFTPAEIQSGRSSGVIGEQDSDKVPVIVLNSQSQSANGAHLKSASHLEINMIWFVIVGLSSLFVLVFVLFVAFMCNRTATSAAAAAARSASLAKKSDKNSGKSTRRSVVYERNMRLLKNSSSSNAASPDSSDMAGAAGIVHTAEELLIDQQQQLLQQQQQQNKTAAELIMQSQMIAAATAAAAASHLSCSNSSSNSTLIKQPQASFQRTPSHLMHHIQLHHHHQQPIMINNPLNNQCAGPLTSSSQSTAMAAAAAAAADMEFYSSVGLNNVNNNNNNNQHLIGLNIGNHHQCFVAATGAGAQPTSTADFLFSSNYANDHPNLMSSVSQQHQQQQQQQQQQQNMDEFIASPSSNVNAYANFSNTSNFSSSEQMFLRHTIRPKPIAIPISSNSPMAAQIQMSGPPSSGCGGGGLDPQQTTAGFFNSSQSTRKSLKNLPMATATLIAASNPQQQSNSNSSNQLVINFSDFNKQSSNGVTANSKLLYTARPFIIENQVNTSTDLYSNQHSPSASSSHSGCVTAHHQHHQQQQQPTTTVSTKSLLQPLKSFGGNGQQCQATATTTSSVSIPNTPAKYCDGSGAATNLVNMTRSPAKKQLLVSLAVNTASAGTATTTTTTATTTAAASNSKLNKADIVYQANKSIENIYDKVNDNQKAINTLKNEELAAEMALEGVMNDLKLITAQQFEC